MKTFYDLLSQKKKKNILPIFGFADASDWGKEQKYPIHPDFYPTNVFPETKTVIVIGIPVILPILETTPSVYYNEHQNNLNAVLENEMVMLSSFLNQQEFASMPTARGGYSEMSVLIEKPAAAFSHRHAAYHAGLGVFGRNNVFLTKKYGPRVRFATILTAATQTELGVPKKKQKKKAGQKKKFEKNGLCINCMACSRFCPIQAINDDPERMYPAVKTDKSRCAAYLDELGKKGTSRCGVCIKVCPVGKDRILFDRRNIGIYDESKINSKKKEQLVRSWNHVRAYGTKK
ncbi:Epoxyqueuosine reductase [Methanimicrococcus sp. At1]|uniref:Epoxyqueuosine reductase n=1 Tax=Methanimicrococcus hacksteinii TaxID=3028293 RepID=A0ABU3VR48_9EURY|nr:4Fe-4S dicluster domain-containing protein [Methanimicrococcus sp. At1]MDV0445888.1 Epoxyqueuosine reductase [Methanimicrococcus sp. At1]